MSDHYRQQLSGYLVEIAEINLLQQQLQSRIQALSGLLCKLRQPPQKPQQTAQLFRIK
jgi:hypothetical protein